ncbi:recombinase family protein [Azospirillum himalayense]|uniref:Recombinase family protein n=1 Tax=Azospirillum himalayense TaxID=654847 RepID=A0ABW0G951_9PROT
MSKEREHPKITASHLSRLAVVYLRQSSAAQVEHHRESTRRQYELAHRAHELGWTQERILVVDADLGLSGSGAVARSGFAQLTADVALGRVGLVLGLEVSRLARNNADWHRLIELAGLTDTLIADADGIYHPALFNDRLLLGLKGAMSEAELHVLRARLDGGRRSKAARGALRRGLPVGFIWGEADGEILLHPDESVVHAIRTVFARFAEMGSARRVWKWFCDQGLRFPRRQGEQGDIRWSPPEYSAIYGVLRSPVYAGAYVYGRTRQETVLNETGVCRKRVKHLAREQWPVLIPDHHEGYIDWRSWEANQQRMEQNMPAGACAKRADKAGAAREGQALLQGLALCGHCGRRLRVRYNGRRSVPNYHCVGKLVMEGREAYCLSVGGLRLDDMVARTFLAALEPALLTATIAAAERLESDHEAVLRQGRLDVERAAFAVNRAERRYRAVDPDNRLVARSLEREWEESLAALEAARIEQTRRERERPRLLTPDERARLLTLGPDLATVWQAPTTTRRDQKELLRTLIEDITVTVDRDRKEARLDLRWKGGELSHLELALPRTRSAPVQTDEETVALVRRLAKHHSDDAIASILTLQGRKTARGHRFDAIRVNGLRRRQKIPGAPRTPRAATVDDAVSIRQAADVLGVAPTTLLRHLHDGLIEAEQITPNAPWRIHLNADLKARFFLEPPNGYVPMFTAMTSLGIPRQAMVQKIKAGGLDAVFVTAGRQKGIYIRVIDTHLDLFEQPGCATGAV